jgi:hypothetical protein
MGGTGRESDPLGHSRRHHSDRLKTGLFREIDNTFGCDPGECTRLARGEDGCASERLSSKPWYE